MQQLRTELRTDIRDNFTALRDHFDDRFNDAATMRDRMHADERYRTVLEEFQGIRKRWHDFRDSLQARVFKDASVGENRHLTMRDVYVFLGGLGAFYFVAKVFKWVP